MVELWKLRKVKNCSRLRETKEIWHLNAVGDFDLEPFII